MKILFLSGSLRRGGSTEAAIDIGIEHLSNKFPEVRAEVVHLCDLRITMCDSCYTCDKERRCWMKDSVPRVVDTMIAADGIVYAFPVHAFGVNSLGGVPDSFRIISITYNA